MTQPTPPRSNEAAVSLIVKGEARGRLPELCPEFQALGLRSTRTLPKTGVVMGFVAPEKLPELRRHPAVRTVMLDGPMMGY